jgi:flagellar biosynthesis/type III secretory pathway M-ring protein FliF/YscJ
MALSRKKKIIIGSAVGALLLIIVIASIFATRPRSLLLSFKRSLS